MKIISEAPLTVELMEKGAGKSIFEVNESKVKHEKIQELIGFNVVLQLEFDQITGISKA
ncbi:hypothetical protein [Echinicola sediminis]